MADSIYLRIFYLMTGILFISSCQPIDRNSFMNSNSYLMVMYGPKVFKEETTIDQDVILYPGAYITTTGTGKIIFIKKVTVIGESQVFDEDVNVEFKVGTLSALNPCWFGARGDDNIEDTKVIQKVLDLAKAYPSSINIDFPIGQYRISKTLELGNVNPSGKSINLVGQSISANSLSGSSLLWIGAENGVLMHIQNYCTSIIENLDFAKGGDKLLKHNIEITPYCYQIVHKNCSFSGCGGPGSANVNLNKGNNLQVSEISFDNCVFRGFSDDGYTWETESAVIGGLANTKNFSFHSCSLLGYTIGAINLETTDILTIENCTFAHNGIDIICLVCNTLAASNYSEHSGAFFRSTVSANVSFTTLMNNCFYGTEGHDYIITQGGGNLTLINNNFGGMGGEDLLNKIVWDSGLFSHIYSIGNFFRNAPPVTTPYEFSGQQNFLPVQTFGDLIGRTVEDIKAVKPGSVKNQ